MKINRNDYFKKSVEAKNRLQDYAGAWRAAGCGCNNCPTCDDRWIEPNKADEIAELIGFLALHSGALEHQLSVVNLDGQVTMLNALNLAREFATGFHGMSRNNAENLADELLDVLNAAIAKGSAPRADLAKEGK
ncbi:hypothetical protein [Stenotrophomonas indicatrix]|uniref:hypothetical protein n=1 Tax=Stenotrophomonas indicatrix TaxID=2045451 RepID=UPI0008B1CE34|nr:hypothetical protein [Stenotrophomonas indicatrix]SET91669.1 hypothetical protein SAMN05720615_109232 [Stenotrophomonas indicatrix]SEU12486.1 hypothetical protein SAMN05720615_11816 [Stenotrophomonas indicatrix]